MNIVQKLTLRQMWQNKRRTLVTIIGVIISVAMLTAVPTLVVTFMDAFQRQTIVETGEWHGLYRDVTKEQIQTIEQDSATENTILSKDIGYARLEGSQNDQKPYLFLKAYDEKGFQEFPIELTEGSLPKASNEVIISEAINEDSGVLYEIGDTIQAEIGDRISLDEDDGNEPLMQRSSLVYAYEPTGLKLMEELHTHSNKEYTIVGKMARPKWEPVWAPGYTVLSYLDDDAHQSGEGIDASVVWKKVNKANKEHAQELANNLGIEKVEFNNELLRYYGLFSDNIRNTLISISSIIMAIIIIGSVSLIYNAFAISVSERSRYLGILSSVGATKKQKRNSVFFEGFIIGLISIPIGVISGITGIGITIKFINPILENAQLGITEGLHVTVTPLSIAIACVVSMLTIILSTYIPARRASRITAIDAIRQAQDIKLTKKSVKTNRLVRKLFGFEAEIALKNLKRNKRKYVATVFSLVISIILFLSVSYFTDSIKQANSMTTEQLNYDISIHKSGQSDEQWGRLVEKAISIDTITAYNVINTLLLSTTVEKSALQDQLTEFMEVNDDGRHQLNANIYTLSNSKLKEYAEQVGVDADALQSQEQVNGIIINKERFDIDGKYYNIEPLKKKIDSLKLYDDISEESYFVDTIHPLAYTDILPIGVNEDWLGELSIIISEKTYQSLLANVNDEDDFLTESSLYIKSNDPMKTEEEIDNIREVALNLSNYYAYQQQDEQLILLLSVFVYGFITLITLISVANIFNTISTSIALRKREFAMLKSMGMTPNGFNKMINYESIFYGMKSLLYGLPISILLMVLMHRAMAGSFSWKFTLPWESILFVAIAIFIIVGSAMLYSSSKVKKENIIDALKQENS